MYSWWWTVPTNVLRPFVSVPAANVLNLKPHQLCSVGAAHSCWSVVVLCVGEVAFPLFLLCACVVF